MAKRPHVRLDTSKQQEGVVKLKFNYGFPDGEEENVRPEEPDYRPMANSFRNYLNRFNQDLRIRHNARNRDLNVPDNIDYIRILFQDQFSLQTPTDNHYQNWYNDYGLMGVNFSKFNCEVLFAVIDSDKFRIFLDNISNFIVKETGENLDVEYSPRIKYIKEFWLLKTADILQFEGQTQLLNLRLIDFPLQEDAVNQIFQSLIAYLNERNIEHTFSEETLNLEILNPSIEQAGEIAANFDIVLSITSSLATVIRPSEFNQEERTYGFEIANSGEDLPIVGILDTGISSRTPLSSITIQDGSFNLTGTSSFEDNAYNGEGHGTPVAALASLGRTPYSQNYRGRIKADAKVLSMKILDNNSGYLSEHAILDMLKRAKATYQEIKIFVLTICYSKHKLNNEDYSTYAYELDKFAHENDCLLFICTGNNHDAVNHNTSYDLTYFNRENTNLSVPAESLNNVIVGGAADGLRDGVFFGISNGKEFPTLFSRKGHIDISSVLKNKRNRNYFRPDVIECAGDYAQGANFIGTGTRATMIVLSADPTRSFTQDVGTSFSAPLTANIAAKIQHLYPSLKAQSIKALIINGASLEKTRFANQQNSLLNKTAGHGFVSPDRSVISNDDSITFIIEDSINPEEVKLIPINFPKYLTQENLGKKRGLIHVTATLCFSFEPVLYNHLGYCPIHIAFNFYRNQSGADILESEEKIKSKLRNNLRWSQDARHKAKPVPYFNTHKIIFQAGYDDFISEKNIFKLAVCCRINPQLLAGQEARYNKSHPFSIALTIEENLRESRGRLYDEMEAVNVVENIADIDLEGEAE